MTTGWFDGWVVSVVSRSSSLAPGNLSHTHGVPPVGLFSQLSLCIDFFSSSHISVPQFCFLVNDYFFDSNLTSCNCFGPNCQRPPAFLSWWGSTDHLLLSCLMKSLLKCEWPSSPGSKVPLYSILQTLLIWAPLVVLSLTPSMESDRASVNTCWINRRYTFWS